MLFFIISWSSLNFHDFPPVRLIGAVVRKIRQKHCSGLVSHDGASTNKLSRASPTKNLDFTIEQISATPMVPKNETVGYSVIREVFQNLSIPPEYSKLCSLSLGVI